MDLGLDPTATPDAAVSADRAEQEQRARERVDGWLQRVGDFFVQTLDHLRFVVFLLYLVLGAIAFWLWIMSIALDVVRLGLRVLLWGLLYAGAARPRRHPDVGVLEAMRREASRLWAARGTYVHELARPVAWHYIGVRRTLIHFWHWAPHQKIAAFLVAAALIVVPALYVVPRAHYVQITDDNAMDYVAGDGSTMRVRYLIHAVDIDDPTHTREYQNEVAWWLGKINPQGLKAQLVPGRFYKLEVVGIRWYFLPTLYPNIISAQETDANGVVLDRPSSFVPAISAAP
jgi:hypothetical protein